MTFKLLKCLVSKKKLRDGEYSTIPLDFDQFVLLQAKHLAQLLVIGGQAVARAFRQALKQEYQGMMQANSQ